MIEVLRFLKTYEVLIYLIVAFIATIYFRKLIMAIKEWREAIFGLERESAHRKLTRTISTLVILLLIVVGEFVMVSVVSDYIPNILPLSTPTLGLVTTPTTTLPASDLQPGEEQPAVSTTQPVNAGCIKGQLEFTSPFAGEKVQGEVELIGTVNIVNFGFYKYEVGQANLAEWRTIAAGNQVVNEGVLGRWDTTQLIPGDYLLRLVVFDNQGTSMTPCVIPVQVISP